jgi:hypothetical protein
MFLLFWIPAVLAAQSRSLSQSEITEAIETGRQYKDGPQFLARGMRDAKTVSVARYTDVIFCDDRDAIALEAANAKHRLQDLKVSDVRSEGRLHAIVTTLLSLSLLNRPGDVTESTDYLRESNLVLMIDGRQVQPVAKHVAMNRGRSRVTMAFEFEVTPSDLENPVTVISVDGDNGTKHTKKKVDLSGILR